MIKRFAKDECGATVIEYALIGAMLSVAVIAAISLLGAELRTTYENTATKVSASVN